MSFAPWFMLWPMQFLAVSAAIWNQFASFAFFQILIVATNNTGSGFSKVVVLCKCFWKAGMTSAGHVGYQIRPFANVFSSFCKLFKHKLLTTF